MDIKRQTFKKTFKGYDPEEVQTFLDMISDQFEALLKEKAELAAGLEKSTAEAERLRSLEKTIQDTLSAARKSSEEMKESATHGARLIVKEAEIEASHVKAEAARERDALKKDIIVLRDQKRTFLIRMRSILNAQLEIIGLMEKEDVSEEVRPPAPAAGDEEVEVKA